MVTGDPFQFHSVRGIWMPVEEEGYTYDSEIGLYVGEQDQEELRDFLKSLKKGDAGDSQGDLFQKIVGDDRCFFGQMKLKSDLYNTLDKGLSTGKRKQGQSSSFYEICKNASEGEGGRTGQRFRSPRAIKEILDKTVIGQQRAKETVSIAVYEHIRNAEMEGNYTGSNVLMIGPTGVGKTKINQELSKHLDVPYEVVKCGELVQPGIVGTTLESTLKSLARRVNGNPASQSPMFGDLFRSYTPAPVPDRKGVEAIVQFDEIDKIAERGGNVYSGALMNQIIGLMDGGTKYGLNLDNVLFIASGAFEGLEDTSGKSREIGFGNSRHRNNSHGRITDDQLVNYGLKRELVGRFTNRTYLDPLGEDDLYRILTEAEGSVLQETVSFYRASEDVTFTFTDEALRDIASYANEKGSGGRALQGIFESVLHPYKIDIEDYCGTTVEIGADVVREAFI